MKPKIKLPEEKLIPASKLKDGMFAVAVDWPTFDYNGLVLTKAGEMLTSIQGDHYWANGKLPDNCRVRVLPPGTEISFIV